MYIILALIIAFRRRPRCPIRIAENRRKPYTGSGFDTFSFPTQKRVMQQLTPLKHSKRPFFVGVDVGGTNTKIGLVDDLGQTLAYDSIPTNEETGPADCLERSAATGPADGRRRWASQRPT